MVLATSQQQPQKLLNIKLVKVLFPTTIVDNSPEQRLLSYFQKVAMNMRQRYNTIFSDLENHIHPSFFHPVMKAITFIAKNQTENLRRVQADYQFSNPETEEWDNTALEFFPQTVLEILGHALGMFRVVDLMVKTNRIILVTNCLFTA